MMRTWAGRIILLTEIGLFLVLLFGVFLIWRRIDSSPAAPADVVSPDGRRAIRIIADDEGLLRLEIYDRNDSGKVKVDEIATRASVYQKFQVIWPQNDCIAVFSSDIGDTLYEYREGAWLPGGTVWGFRSPDRLKTAFVMRRSGMETVRLGIVTVHGDIAFFRGRYEVAPLCRQTIQWLNDGKFRLNTKVAYLDFSLK